MKNKKKKRKVTIVAHTLSQLVVGPIPRTHVRNTSKKHSRSQFKNATRKEISRSYSGD